MPQCHTACRDREALGYLQAKAPLCLAPAWALESCRPGWPNRLGVTSWGLLGPGFGIDSASFSGHPAGPRILGHCSTPPICLSRGKHWVHPAVGLTAGPPPPFRYELRLWGGLIALIEWCFRCSASGCRRLQGDSAGLSEPRRLTTTSAVSPRSGSRGTASGVACWVDQALICAWPTGFAMPHHTHSLP